MRTGIETRLEGSTLVVRIPMRFQRRGGRNRIVAPDGSAIVPMLKPQPDGTLVKALARAHRWRRMLDEGRFASARELAEAEGSVTPTLVGYCASPYSHRMSSSTSWTGTGHRRRS